MNQRLILKLFCLARKGGNRMKKILPIFFILVVIFNFAGCGNTAASNEQTSPKTSESSKNELTDEHNKSQTDSTKEATSVEKNIKMNITVNNTIFTATLEDNETTKAFVKQLPLTLDMSELNGNEKYNYLSSNLSADKSSSTGKINEGDLMVYGNNCLVLFYNTFNTSYSYVKLGHIDNTTGLNKAVGSGSVKVTYSINE